MVPSLGLFMKLKDASIVKGCAVPRKAVVSLYAGTIVGYS